MVTRPKIYLRADGNASMGLGHVSRMLAVATMLKEDYDCRFIIRQPSPQLQAEIQAQLEAIILLEDIPLEEEASYLSSFHLPTVMVVDGYHFNEAYILSLLDKGWVVLAIDDLVSGHYKADAVLNHTGGISPSEYEGAFYTRYFLGMSYALLRTPFLEAATIERSLPETDRVLVCMGGADPHRYTVKTLQNCLNDEPHAFFEVVVGSAFSDGEALQTLKEAYSHRIEIHRHISAEEMVALMKNCRRAITAASTIAYEYAAVGGWLYVVQTADNQEGIHRYLLRTGLAKPLSQWGQPADFAATVARQRLALDGQSPQRIRTLIKELAIESRLAIRKATPEDAHTLFQWINEPEARANSTNPEPIAWETHVGWFSRKLLQADSYLYIFEYEAQPIGQVRLDIASGQGVISYLLDKQYRGKGFGTLILKKAILQIKKEKTPPALITGTVKESNVASRRCFEKLQFRVLQTYTEKGEQYLTFGLQPS